jgi:hypothetical protein
MNRLLPLVWESNLSVEGQGRSAREGGSGLPIIHFSRLVFSFPEMLSILPGRPLFS